MSGRWVRRWEAGTVGAARWGDAARIGVARAPQCWRHSPEVTGGLTLTFSRGAIATASRAAHRRLPAHAPSFLTRESARPPTHHSARSYKGIGPTMVTGAPYTGIQMTAYELMQVRG